MCGKVGTITSKFPGQCCVMNSKLPGDAPEGHSLKF